MRDRYKRDGFFTGLIEQTGAHNVEDYTKAMRRAFDAYRSGDAKDDDFVNCACGNSRFHVHLSGRLVCSTCYSEYSPGVIGAQDSPAE